jgi:hypothetical protein
MKNIAMACTSVLVFAGCSKDCPASKASDNGDAVASACTELFLVIERAPVRYQNYAEGEWRTSDPRPEVQLERELAVQKDLPLGWSDRSITRQMLAREMKLCLRAANPDPKREDELLERIANVTGDFAMVSKSPTETAAAVAELAKLAGEIASLR